MKKVWVRSYKLSAQRKNGGSSPNEFMHDILQKIGLDAVTDNFLNEKVSPAIVSLLTESEMKTFCL